VLGHVAVQWSGYLAGVAFIFLSICSRPGEVEQKKLQLGFSSSCYRRGTFAVLKMANQGFRKRMCKLLAEIGVQILNRRHSTLGATTKRSMCLV